MKRVLLLSEEEAKGILFLASKSGHDIYVAGNLDRNSYLQHSPKLKKFIPLKSRLKFSENTDDLMNEIIGIIKKERIDVLVPSSFGCIKITSKHREQFQKYADVMPTPKLETIDELDNKYSFFKFCKKNSIAHPVSFLLSQVSDLRKIESNPIQYPVIVKPVLGSGEKGLEIFQNFDDMRKFYENKSASTSLPALVQEYFEGEDIDFNGFGVDGEIKAWSVMHTTFYDKATSFRLTDYTEHNEVKELGFDIVKYSKFSGPLNIDMRIRNSDNKVFLIEVNPRF